MSRISRLLALTLTVLLLLGGTLSLAGAVTTPPLAVADAGDVAAGRPAAAASRLTAGDKHTCAITSDAPLAGRVFCWGNNTLGQLGLGDTANRGDQPGEMGNALSPVELGGQSVAISAGTAHTCAVMAGGDVKCWGDNSSGQLGLGDTATRGDQAIDMGVNLPVVNLGTAARAVDVAAGLDFSCALLDTGAVKCWGGNEVGQLGQGDTANRGDQPGEMGDALPAIDLGTERTAIAIAAGGAFVCAVLDTHAVKCWGNNDSGQLGQGDTANRGDQPGEMGDALPAIDLGTGVTARAVSAGRFHGCALVTRSRVKCWGSNASGQLGLVGTGARGDQPGEMGDALAGVTFPSDTLLDGVVTTGNGTCVFGLSASTRCFGANGKGQLDLGSTADQTGWAWAAMPPVAALAGGLEHLCWTLPAGSVRCVGANDSGQLGQGDTAQRGGDPASTNPPAIVLRRTATPSSVDAGNDHTCVIVDDGVLRCVGRNYWGQLGQGDTTSRGATIATNGDNVPAVDLGTGRRAVQVSAGDGNTCAVLDNGQLKCWGRNAWGILGLGDTATRGDEPGEMGDALPAVDLGTGRTAVEVGTGEMVTCARLDNGQVKCWGLGTWGALGQGDQETRGDQPGEMGDNLPPIDLGTGRRAIGLVVGYGFVCALLDDHTVKCWGYYDNGQIGWTNFNYIGNGPGEMGDALSPLNLGTGRTALQIDGEESVCAVLDDHSVKCWGLNEHGEAGHGDTLRWGTDAAHWGDNLPAVPLGTGRTALSVAVGRVNSCARLDNGTLKCWGTNSTGQLGIDTMVAHGDGTGPMGDGLPAVILPGDTPVAVTAGGAHTCALLASQRVKCWGYNLWGQLGVASTNNSFGHYAGSMAGLPVLDPGGSLNRVLADVTTPGFADDVVATPANQSVTLQWTTPDDGGSPITGYLVQRSADGVHWVTAVNNTGSAAITTTVSGLANGTAQRFRVAAISALGSGPVSAPSAPVTPVTTAYWPVTPFRLADTRKGATTGDGVGAGTGAVPAKGVLKVKVAGRGGVPTGAKAAVLHVTVVAPTTAGGALVFPCGTTRPQASTLSFAKGVTAANTAISKLGADGSVCIYVTAATHVVVDVNGAMPAGNSYVALNPARLAANTPVKAGGTVAVKVLGRSGVPTNATSTVVNVTVSGSATAGRATVFACGSTRPASATVQFAAKATAANVAIVKVGTQGSICVHSTAAVNVTIDVDGAFPTAAYSPLAPFRLASTKVAAKGTATVQVAGRGGVPTNAKAATLTITVSNAAASGGIVVYPCGTPRPLASATPFRAGVTVAGSTIAKLGTNGSVCVYSTAAATITVDVVGRP